IGGSQRCVDRPRLDPRTRTLSRRRRHPDAAVLRSVGTGGEGCGGGTGRGVHPAEKLGTLGGQLLPPLRPAKPWAPGASRGGPGAKSRRERAKAPKELTWSDQFALEQEQRRRDGRKRPWEDY